MSFFNRHWSFLGMCLAALSLFASAARAQPQPVLLTVDISNPAQIRFTTTGAFPQTNHNTETPLGGILIMDLFTADFIMGSNAAPLTGNLAASGSVRFEVGYSDFIASKRNLNLLTQTLSPGANDPMTFTTTTPAFVGSSVMDLSGFPVAALQAPGFIGDVRVGDGVNNPVLGTYQVVVPEPIGAAALGVAVLCCRRRRAV